MGPCRHDLQNGVPSHNALVGNRHRGGDAGCLGHDLETVLAVVGCPAAVASGVHQVAQSRVHQCSFVCNNEPQEAFREGFLHPRVATAEHIRTHAAAHSQRLLLCLDLAQGSNQKLVRVRTTQTAIPNLTRIHFAEARAAHDEVLHENRGAAVLVLNGYSM